METFPATGSENEKIADDETGLGTIFKFNEAASFSDALPIEEFASGAFVSPALMALPGVLS